MNDTDMKWLIDAVEGVTKHLGDGSIEVVMSEPQIDTIVEAIHKPIVASLDSLTEAVQEQTRVMATVAIALSGKDNETTRAAKHALVKVSRETTRGIT